MTISFPLMLSERSPSECSLSMFTLPSPFSLLNFACIKCGGISALLHEQTYKATIAIQEYLTLLSVLSQSIMKLSAAVEGLRACMIVRISSLISFFLH